MQFLLVKFFFIKKKRFLSRTKNLNDVIRFLSFNKSVPGIALNTCGPYWLVLLVRRRQIRYGHELVIFPTEASRGLIIS